MDCSHPEKKVRCLPSGWEWCGRCGALATIKKIRCPEDEDEYREERCWQYPTAIDEVEQLNKGLRLTIDEYEERHQDMLKELEGVIDQRETLQEELNRIALTEMKKAEEESEKACNRALDESRRSYTLVRDDDDLDELVAAERQDEGDKF